MLNLVQFQCVQIIFGRLKLHFKITCGETDQGENWHCGVTKVSITYNIMHYEGVPVCSYYVIAEFASVQIIFGATVFARGRQLVYEQLTGLQGPLALEHP